MTTYLELLEAPVRDAPALGTVDGTTLTYAHVTTQVLAIAGALRRAGLSRDRSTAIVMPNGLEMALLLLATGAAGASAPLNPAYGRDELDFYLADLQPDLLLVGRGIHTPARDLASRRGVRVIEVGTATAGLEVELDGQVPTLPLADRPAPEETALILHTSGTTARPKQVPLTHANLLASAGAVARTLHLAPGDRCLNVMPLFHIHGIVAALLASLRAGAEVVCAPGFLAPSFFDWLARTSPTWYTAVPTMHQAILARAATPDAARALQRARLRFVRSSSAALPVATLEALEATLGVPVIEAYGMTEAAHQMASNPLPPGRRKPGAVGPAAGPRIAILDDAGCPLPPGALGEVAIQGPNVTAGYVANAEANARAFTGGWFRTGDQGRLDDDGYLHLTGRLKELINRGGEKIAPLEVEDVLMAHPDVAQALCFAVPHPTLGEEVGAAVVPRPGSTPDTGALRRHAAARLAYFKVPRYVRVLDALPLGPTGKPQRVGLAARLGVTADVPVDDTDATAPGTPTEEIVALAWAEVMGQPAPGVHRNFFALGGDSLLATRLVARLRDLLGVDVPLLTVFDEPTVSRIAACVDRLLAADDAVTSPDA